MVKKNRIIAAAITLINLPCAPKRLAKYSGKVSALLLYSVWIRKRPATSSQLKYAPTVRPMAIHASLRPLR